MSLLLDALKRAEQEKLAKSAEAAPAERDRLAPAPKAVEKDRGATSPKGALELQPIAAPPPSAPRAAMRAEPEAANMPSSGKAPGSRRSGAIWAIAGAIVVVLIAAGAYVWWQVEALKPQVAVRARPAPAPVAPAASGRIEAPARIDPLLTTLPQRAAPETAAPPAPAPARKRDVSEEIVSELLKQAAPASVAPVHLSRSEADRPRVSADVSAGYEQLRNGKVADARRSYMAALSAEPANLDAVLGIATVEATSGNRGAAAAYYRRALEIDPRNGTALAGLAALADFSQPEALEAQLRADIARNAQSAALHFTLGNLYASQSRWAEAQTAYFEAHRLDIANGDIAFNLAVSLDHMGQPRLAADFYRRALESAQARAVQFDPAAARRRLAELRP